MIILGKKRRAIKTTTDVAELKRYPCGEFALIDSRSLLEPIRRWLIVRRMPAGGEYVYSRHRQKGAAIKAIEKLLQ